MVLREHQDRLGPLDNQDLLGRPGQGVNQASQDKMDNQVLGERLELQEHQDRKDSPDP
jgi:hypothetical protein